MNKSTCFILALLVLCGLIPESFAEWEFLSRDFFQQSQCPSTLVIPKRNSTAHASHDSDSHDLGIFANEGVVEENGVNYFQGDVEILMGHQMLRADEARFDTINRSAKAEGNMQYWDKGYFLQGQSAEIDYNSEVKKFKDVEYKIIGRRNAWGRADSLRAEADLIELQNATYSKCDPQDGFWVLDSKKIKLYRDKNRGEVHRGVFKIKDIPVLYIPYLSFPIDLARKSGFLPFVYTYTNESGLGLDMPFYWNIAPNQDATITPRWFDKRGLMLATEYRYLLQKGAGKLYAEYLPDDPKFSNRDRNFVSFKHRQNFSGGGLDIAFGRVSDQNYFSSFGSQLDTSQHFLDRRLEVFYSNNLSKLNLNWKARLRLQSYQNLTRNLAVTSQPFQRLPQLLLDFHTPRKNYNFNYGGGSEWVRFYRSGRGNKDTTTRTYLSTYLEYPMQEVYGYINPRLSLNYTHYSLTQSQNLGSNQDRFLPIFSLDSTVRFDRDLRFGTQKFVQTLEPRAYYLYVPEVDQVDIPIFDTGAIDTNVGALFRDNRFTGIDRIGDANQLALTVGSKLYHSENGNQLMHVSMGQLYFFKEREVTLPGQSIERDSSSVLIADFSVKPIEHINIDGEWQWNPHLKHVDRLSYALRYQPTHGKIFRASYRSNRDSATNLKYVGTSFRWPLSQRWGVLGNWQYAIQEGLSLQWFGGVEYSGCCWRTRFVARRFLTDVNAYQTAFFFQFELKGLLNFGKEAEQVIRSNIPGYL